MKFILLDSNDTLKIAREMQSMNEEGFITVGKSMYYKRDAPLYKHPEPTSHYILLVKTERSILEDKYITLESLREDIGEMEAWLDEYFPVKVEYIDHKNIKLKLQKRSEKAAA